MEKTYLEMGNLNVILQLLFSWSNMTGSCSSPYNEYSDLLPYFQITYTLSEFLFSAEEGVGYTTDFPIDEKAFCFTVPEDFVQIKS